MVWHKSYPAICTWSSRLPWLLGSLERWLLDNGVTVIAQIISFYLLNNNFFPFALSINVLNFFSSIGKP